jgi:hypothetical protein
MVITHGVWNSRDRIPRCDSGAPDMVRTPLAPFDSAGARKVVVPPFTSRMCSSSRPERMRSMTSLGESRYFTVPLGVFSVLNTL